ncbi:MAG: M28 family peptidase, partial [Xanthomonadales bacterium]
MTANRLIAGLLPAALTTLLLGACGGEDAAAPEVTTAPPAPVEAPAESPATDDPIDTAAAAMTEAEYRRHIETLASDAFGGRYPATPGEDLTVAYLVDFFREIGLQPGNGDSYTQDVPLMRLTAVNDPGLVFRGADGAELALAYGPDQVIWTRRQVPEAVLKDSDLVFVGYGINAPERGWNDYEGIDVTGKTVVMLVNDPGFATQDPELFNGNAMTYYGRWAYKFEEAARRGAIAALVIHETEAAGYSWEVASSGPGQNYAVVGAATGTEPVLLQGWIHNAAAAALLAADGHDLASLRVRARRPDFEAFELDGLRLVANLTIDVDDFTSHNVLAKLPGTRRPEEVIMVAAHWDAYGVGEPDAEGRTIRPGANDDALGIAGVLEIAR